MTTDETALDIAHAAMQAAPGDDAARLRFFERVADSELFLLLAREPEGETLEPETFDVTGGRFVLAFDREDRLARFVGRIAPYAALSGRVIAGMLAGQGLGLGLNLEVAPSSILIPSDAVDWLNETLGQAPDQIEAHIDRVAPPGGMPEMLLTALDAKLATATGLAHSAYLVGVTYDHGGQGHMLAFVDALDGAQSALAQAVSEALTFSGVEAGALDVGFFTAADPVAARLAATGLRFDLPQIVPMSPPTPVAPGSDPTKPPILR